MDLLSARDQLKLEYEKRLDNLFQSILSWHPLVFRLTCCSSGSPLDRILFVKVFQNVVDSNEIWVV